MCWLCFIVSWNANFSIYCMVGSSDLLILPIRVILFFLQYIFMKELFIMKVVFTFRHRIYIDDIFLYGRISFFNYLRLLRKERTFTVDNFHDWRISDYRWRTCHSRHYWTMLGKIDDDKWSVIPNVIWR